MQCTGYAKCVSPLCVIDVLFQLEELNEAQLMERRGRVHAAEMHNVVRRMLRRSGSDAETKFSTVIPPGQVSRKHAAAQFHALLVLKKQRVIDVAQAQPYADISIRRGPDFNTKSHHDLCTAGMLSCVCD